MNSEIVMKSMLVTVALSLCALPALAQSSQGATTRIQGNTEINVQAKDVTAIAAGENNVARNRIGVIKGEKKGNTKITVNAANVTTVVGGHNKKACTNIGSIVSDECK